MITCFSLYRSWFFHLLSRYIDREKFVVNLGCYYSPHLLVSSFIHYEGWDKVKGEGGVSLFQPAGSTWKSGATSTSFFQHNFFWVLFYSKNSQFLSFLWIKFMLEPRKTFLHKRNRQKTSYYLSYRSFASKKTGPIQLLSNDIDQSPTNKA